MTIWSDEPNKKGISLAEFRALKKGDMFCVMNLEFKNSVIRRCRLVQHDQYDDGWVIVQDYFPKYASIEAHWLDPSLISLQDVGLVPMKMANGDMRYNVTKYISIWEGPNES